MDLWLIFLTGLTVGGLTCLAVQGGLLASTIAAREDQDFAEGSGRKHNIWPVAAFLTTKFGAYVILGFILGAFGSALALSDTARIVMQLLAGVYMIAIALNLLNVHPIFRYVIIQPPRLMLKWVKSTTRSQEIFAPALLGLLTIFIPCGTTLAMEAFAISSGSPILGAVIMATFTLGTIPLFVGLGFLTTVLGDTFRAKFFKLAGVLVLYLGITTFNSSLVLAGSPITLSTIREAIITVNLEEGSEAISDSIKIINGIQTANITVLPTSYTPNYIQVQSKVPVRLNLITGNGLGCTAAFRIPQLGISKTLAQNSTTPVDFTPTKPGKLTWTCSMGMYRGVIEVI